MKQYTLAEARERQGEIFELADLEPVVLVEASHPSHVVMSFEIYQQLLERLTDLEDLVWERAATEAIRQSRSVGEAEFTEALKSLTNGKA
jgi:PHD/YefM family antitoxin component YafN of YafNO toxin-antitoxin module